MPARSDAGPGARAAARRPANPSRWGCADGRTKEAAQRTAASLSVAANTRVDQHVLPWAERLIFRTLATEWLFAVTMVRGSVVARLERGGVVVFVDLSAAPQRRFRHNTTVRNAQPSRRAISAFVFPSAASNTIFARNTSPCGAV
jgi:hypothetical protein